MVSVMSGMLAQAVAVSRRRPQTRTRQATVIAVTPLTVLLDGSDVEITVQENFHGPVQLGQRILVERVGQRWCVDAVPPAPWVTPALLNGWESYSEPGPQGFNHVGYRTLPHGVQLRGLIRNGTLDEPAFLLPPGSVASSAALTGWAAPGQACRISTRWEDQAVIPSVGASTAWTSLDGLIVPTG